MVPELFRDDVFRLETRRLWLRWPTARDESAIERFVGDAGVAEMTASIPHPYPKGAAASFIYQARVGNAQGAALTFVLAPLMRPADAIGVLGLQERDGETALGYWLGRPHWGRGLMSEAVDALSGGVLAMAGVSSIVARTRTDNPASRRVLEKCGFVLTGTRAVHFLARGASYECAFYERRRETATLPAGSRIGLR